MGSDEGGAVVEWDVEVAVVSFSLRASSLTFYCTLDQALEKQLLIVVRIAEGIKGIITKRKDEIGWYPLPPLPASRAPTKCSKCSRRVNLNRRDD